MTAIQYPRVQQYIRSRIGTSVARLSHHVIDSSIGLFMSQWDCTSEEQLLQLISESEDAYADLIHRTTVKETYFYREPQMLLFAVTQIVPRLLAQKGSLSILSAGCSTGAEPYSLAIAIEDRLGPAILQRCSVHGFDVDPKAITIAEKGMYTRHALRGVPLSIQEEYLQKEKDKPYYHIAPHIGEHVSFSVANLIDKEQIANLDSFDIIFYRNVSIYFDELQRKAIFRSLSERLNEGGKLFTSSSETLPHDIGILRLVQESGVFYFSKEPIPEVKERRIINPIIGKRQKHVPLPTRIREHRKRRETVPAKWVEEPVRKAQEKSPEQIAVQQARTGSLSSALQFIAQISPDHPSADRLKIVKAGILFEQNLKEEAKSVCEEVISRDPMSTEAHIILSMIYKIDSEFDKAVKELKTVLYIDPDCWIALYYSADIYMQSGEKKLAKRNYQRVIESLEKDTIKDYLLIFTVNEQTAAQIIRLCRYSLSQI